MKNIDMHCSKVILYAAWFYCLFFFLMQNFSQSRNNWNFISSDVSLLFSRKPVHWDLSRNGAIKVNPIHTPVLMSLVQIKTDMCTNIYFNANLLTLVTRHFSSLKWPSSGNSSTFEHQNQQNVLTRFKIQLSEQRVISYGRVRYYTLLKNCPYP